MTKFTPPKLHIVLADDSVHFLKQLEKHLISMLEGWGLARTNQITCIEGEIFHRCRSVNKFRKTISSLLDTSKGTDDLVFAVLDLNMPDEEGDPPRAQAGKDMAKLCAPWRDSNPRFDYCMISGEPDILRDLIDSELGAKLRKREVRCLYKGVDHRSALGCDAWEDVSRFVKSFVCRNLRFCHFPDASKGGGTTLIDFGEQNELRYLLERADAISGSPNGGLYVLFANAAGYEEDWFKLCCYLREETPPRIHDFGGNFTGWEAHIEHPPSALLLRRIDKAFDNQLEVMDAITRHNFFEKLEHDGNERSLVFFQFPLAQPDNSVSEQLDTRVEQELYRACVNKVYANKRHEGDDPPEHDHCIYFPTREDLQRAGILRTAIELQVQECQKAHKLEHPQLDPEVIELLQEGPADRFDKFEGLRDLRTAIRAAFESYANKAPRPDRVTVDCFRRHEQVRNDFNDVVGFKVRGQRLYRILEEDRLPATGASPSSTGNEACERLTVCWRLFDDLERLIQLQQHLDDNSMSSLTRAQLPEEKFRVLREAYKFLKILFGSPARLAQLVDEFKPNKSKPNWKSYYPNLREKQGWLKLVHSIPFTWPYAQISLHSAVYDYLKLNGVNPTIQLDCESLVDEYPQHVEDWSKLEKDRVRIIKDIEDTENQKWKSEGFVRKSHGQPVVVHLERSHDGTPPPAPQFMMVFESLIRFNACIAVCEAKHHLETGERADINKLGVEDAIRDPQLGDCIKLLSNYVDEIENGVTQSKVLHNWRSEWPTNCRGQTDAANLATSIASAILKKYEKEFAGSKYSDLKQLAELRNAAKACPPSLLLNALNNIRNKFHKHDAPPDFWRAFYLPIWDLFRRFVTATAPDPEYRFGILSADGQHARLWTRHGPEPVNAVEVRNKFDVERACVFVASKQSFYPLFSIDELIRFDPKDFSVFAFCGRDWRNLSHVTPEQTIFVDSPATLLPQREISSLVVAKPGRGKS